MRVIAGSSKGHRLKCLEGLNTRPTADKVKEALFNILQYKINGAVVLDLFAGSGALGIEALSRGANTCTFIEKNPKAAKIIEENLQHTKLSDQALLYVEDSIHFLKHTEELFDLIFLDPPYRLNLLPESLNLIASKKLLSPDGVVVVEFDAQNKLEPVYDALEAVDSRKYGRILLQFYQYKK